MYIKPSQNLQVYCYVEADFAGLWGVEHDQDPTCVKSRTGYLIGFMSCSLIWVSKFHTQIALSTMESKYVALAHSMRDLIAIRGFLQEINDNMFDKSLKKPSLRTHSRTLTQIPQSVVYEDNESYLNFATMPKMSSRTKHIAISYYFFLSLSRGTLSLGICFHVRYRISSLTSVTMAC